MSEYSLSATLKAGTGFDAPWVVVYANHPDELNAKLRSVIEGETIELVVAGAIALRTAFQVGALPENPPQQAQEAPQNVSQGPWGTQPPAQPAQPAWGAQPQGGPKQCALCGSALVTKTGNYKSGQKAGQPYTLDACPNNRQRGDGHTAIWH